MFKSLGGQKRAGGPHSMEKRGPEHTRGGLGCLHGQEMPLGKKGEIWRGCKETRGCLRGLGVPKRAVGPNSVQKDCPEHRREGHSDLQRAKEGLQGITNASGGVLKGLEGS